MRKVKSIRVKGSMSASAAPSDQFHTLQITVKPINPSTSMVPVTATP